MADNNNPFSVRMEADDKEKLMELIQGSGKSSKEFMGILMGAYELNKVKIDIPEVAEDINHLEALSNQINTIYVNMAKRIQTIDESKVLQFNKDMEIYKSKIESLNVENETLKTDKEDMETTLQGSFNISDELKKQVKQLSEITESNKALILEYKEKNDTLAGLVTEYKGFKNENETVKTLLADSQARKIDLENKIISKDIEVDTLKTKLEAVAVEAQKQATRFEELKEFEKEKTLLAMRTLETKMEATVTEAQKEVTRISQLKEFEKEKALLQQEKLFNKKMQELQEQSNKKILEYQKQAEEYIREMQRQSPNKL
ncbi:hypothetical protein K2F40_14765 [Clostridium sp. CM028]|uniref:hypothetical protein n=1 Tax=unclassified Clostridium TaxID=2614128 RepID=UPI001C6EB61C|nr:MULTISPECIES: hypothetical protein [unclassified Clostridium]MBW9146846.1 hypothetical protein [Clostridium sp. CM027]MBW9150220.1 hypothetical protein [Clostridium sp. CM028]UVE42827.1 hypothetical protein KTC92_18055 [Clostridium sp. CM027]WLC63484.1 hypothetical protein KTC94_17310 [Clostridium sp. CM028]